MAHDPQHDSKRPRGPSSFREAREQGGDARHGAHTLEDSRSDHSMDPQPVDLPRNTGSAAGSVAGAAAGAVVGAAAGMIGGPAGMAAGAVAGAAVGGSAGRASGQWADRQDEEGLEDKRRKDGDA